MEGATSPARRVRWEKPALDPQQPLIPSQIRKSTIRSKADISATMHKTFAWLAL